MARIPDVDSFGSAAPQPTLDVAVARPQMSDVGRGVSAMGRDLEDAAQTIAETNLRQDSMNAQFKANELSGVVSDLQDGPNGFATVRGQNAVGPKFLADYTQRYNDQLQSIRSSITSPNQQRLFDQHEQVQQLQFRAKLLSHQSAETDKANESTENATIDSGRKTIFTANGEKNATAAGIAQMEWAIDQKAARLGWSAETTAATKQTYMSKVIDDAADIMRARDPVAMLALINQRLGVGNTPAGAPGMTEPGNIDLQHRPHVKNSDGSVSTVRSLGVNIDGQEVLIPTVSEDGRVMSDQEALAQYKATGKHLGKFTSAEASTAYAQRLHEDQARLLEQPRGIRNNNPGNLEPLAGGWPGQTGTDGRFATFATPQAGIQAATRNLVAYQDAHGINTIQGIVSRWAPGSDGNDVASYVASIAKDTGLPADKPLDLHDSGVMMKLVTAMVQHENGQQPYPPGVIQEGVASGLGLSSLNPQNTPAALVGPAAPGGGPLDLNDMHLQPTGNAIVDGGSVQQLMEWRLQAHREAERSLGQNRTALEQKTKDFQAMVLAGAAPPAGSVPSAQEYAAAFGPAAETRYRNEVANYVQLGQGLGVLKDASLEERQGLIARFSPVPGEGFEGQQQVQATLVRANQLLEKQLATDPAAFAGRTPRVQATSAAMQAVFSDKNSTPEARSAAVDAYVQTTTAEQQRLGIENIRADVLGEEGKRRQLGVRLLTNGQANAIADSFRANSANAAQIMDGLQQQWGSHFPQVFSQLAQDDKIPPAALVIPNMATSFGKETLARLSADPGLQKKLEESLPAGMKKDIDAKLESLNEPFYGSLAFQQGGQGTYTNVRSQQTLLAINSVLSGHSAGDAAAAAFEETVGHQYQFANTLRIPKVEQPDQVLRGTAAVTKNPALLSTQPPQSFRSNLAPVDRDAAWHDAMRNGATWVANGDETGATLYVRARSDSGSDALFAARGNDGKPMTWSWNQLRTIAANVPPPPQPVTEPFAIPGNRESDIIRPNLVGPPK